MKFSARTALHACLVVVLAAIVVALYARTVGYGYVWDDRAYLSEYRPYVGIQGVIRALTEPFFVRAYYRPLATLSFTLSPEPSVQHMVNVLLHICNAILALLCARALMPRAAADSVMGRIWACAGAMVFAVHPLTVEPVVWVSGRFDVLMCSFVLGACLVALGGELTRQRLALVCVLFFAAMCSKEAAIGLPVALPVLLLLKWRLNGEEVGLREMVRRLVPLLSVTLLAAALYAAARLAVVQHVFAGEDTGTTFAAGGNLLDKLNIAALAVVAFARLIVNPWSHSAPMHPFKYEAGSGVLLQTMMVLAVVLALLVLTVLKKPRMSFPLALLAALAMSWPTLHLIGILSGDNIISDRYALAPLALLAAALSAVAGAWQRKRVGAIGNGGKHILACALIFVFTLAGALAAHSSATIPLWRNDHVLWHFTHERVPASRVAHENYISVLMEQERWQEAGAELKKFLLQYPDARQNMKIGDACDWMLIRAHTGDYDGALELFVQIERSLAGYAQKMDDTNSAFSDLYRNRGIIEGHMGNWEAAAHYFGKHIEIAPDDAGTRGAFLYAQALFMTGQHEKSEEIFNLALAGSTKDMAAWALEWRKTWRLPEAAAEGAAGQGASAAASAPASAP